MTEHYTLKFHGEGDGSFAHCPIGVAVAWDTGNGDQDDTTVTISENGYTGTLTAKGCHERYVLGKALERVAKELTKELDAHEE